MTTTEINLNALAGTFAFLLTLEPTQKKAKEPAGQRTRQKRWSKLKDKMTDK